MRGSLQISALMALSLAACRSGGDGQPVREFDGNGTEQAPRARVAVPQGTAVIDQARILSPAEKALLEKHASAAAKASGRKLTVVLLRPAEGQSLEQVAWAIVPSAPQEGPILLVVDVASGSVRVEGVGDPADAAEIARAIGPDVRTGRISRGITRGLDQVSGLGRRAA